MAWNIWKAGCIILGILALLVVAVSLTKEPSDTSIYTIQGTLVDRVHVTSTVSVYVSQTGHHYDAVLYTCYQDGIEFCNNASIGKNYTFTVYKSPLPVIVGGIEK
jgi:hypothetical protein